jgi:hypothetical protein
MLDSNATVFNARTMRDNSNISARRRVRGSGVAAGKGYCARMRKLFEVWEEEGTASVRGVKNKGQCRNLHIITRQMKAWAEDNKNPWKRNYFDEKEKNNQ